MRCVRYTRHLGADSNPGNRGLSSFALMDGTQPSTSKQGQCCFCSVTGIIAPHGLDGWRVTVPPTAIHPPFSRPTPSQRPEALKPHRGTSATAAAAAAAAAHRLGKSVWLVARIGRLSQCCVSPLYAVAWLGCQRLERVGGPAGRIIVDAERAAPSSKGGVV